MVGVGRPVVVVVVELRVRWGRLVVLDGLELAVVEVELDSGLTVGAVGACARAMATSAIRA